MIAATECILMPFGTVLGVLTLIVLTRESVKKLFEEKKTPAFEGAVAPETLP